MCLRHRGHTLQLTPAITVLALFRDDMDKGFDALEDED